MKTYYPNVVFAGYTCKIIWGRYPNGNLAIRLQDINSGNPIATATTNLVEVVMESGHVCIKDYRENEGMVNALSKAGIVEKIVRPRPVAVLNLTPEALTLLQESTNGK